MVRLRSSTAIWRRSAIDSNTSVMRVRGSLPVAGNAGLSGIAMPGGYRQDIKTTNEFVWMEFEEGRGCAGLALPWELNLEGASKSPRYQNLDGLRWKVIRD